MVRASSITKRISNNALCSLVGALLGTSTLYIPNLRKMRYSFQDFRDGLSSQSFCEVMLQIHLKTRSYHHCHFMSYSNKDPQALHKRRPMTGTPCRLQHEVWRCHCSLCYFVAVTQKAEMMYSAGVLQGREKDQHPPLRVEMNMRLLFPIRPR